MRIVSLLPSATEIVYALGLQRSLVGVSFECDEPPLARTDHHVLVSGLDTHGLTPGQIDAAVRDKLALGENLYTLHAGALRALDPDLVLTQDLCQVCALPAGEVDAALGYLGCRADVVTLDPHRLADVLDDIQLVGLRAGIPDRARRFADGLRDRLAAVEAVVAGRARPRVALLEWIEPPFEAGHWVPDLVTAAGGVPVLGTAGARSTEIAWSAVAAARPDLVLIAPCGFHLSAAADQARSVLPYLPPEVPVWAIDADGLVVRPGPRLVDGVEAIASVLHPDLFPANGSVQRVR